MEFFQPTATETSILEAYLDELSLLDLSTNRVRLVMGSKEPIVTKNSIRPLFLTTDFEIGAYRLVENQQDAALLIEEIIVAIYERSWLDHMMAITNRPLSLEQGEYTYYRGIAESLAEATLARVAIIHLADTIDPHDPSDGFPILTIYDRDEVLEEVREVVHLPAHREPYKSFLNAEVSAQPVVRVGGTYGPAEEILEYIDDRDLKTIIILPLSLGGDRSGNLTLGFDSKIGLSETVELTFRSLGGHAVAAVENYRKLQDLDSLRNQRMTDHIESTQLELMQGFRHVAGGALFNAQAAYQEISMARDVRSKSFEAGSQQLRDALNDISGALEQMSQLRRFEKGQIEVDIFDVFDEALASLEHQIAKGSITIRRQKSGSMRAMLNAAGIKYAFINLLLNSIQAFEDSPKRDRVITLNGTRSGNDITIDFSDNGPGIRIGQGEILNFDDIWVPGKTSKKSGTGYGLPFVRDMIQREHHGSINLRPSTRGVTFRIKLRAR